MTPAARRAAPAVAELGPLMGPYLARQRWADRGQLESGTVETLDSEVVVPGPPSVLWMLVRAGEAVYQVTVGLRPLGDEIALGDRDIIGEVTGPDGPLLAYDALVDPVLARPLVRLTGADVADGAFVRSVGAEQSNSSLVVNEKLIVKFFRRLRRGPNPDVETTLALDAVGFNHVAPPMGRWRRGDYDLAVAQEYLAGGTEGWALALTSLRDLYGCDEDDPASAGGDFAGEAGRIGEMTGRLHLAMAEAFGTHPGDVGAWVSGLTVRLESLGLDRRLVERAHRLVERVGGLADPGPSIRVHGDYHLGQVMRTDVGWFVLDFEGEPERPLEERTRPTSALKDVGGMLRSLDYAAAVSGAEREAKAQRVVGERGRAWEQRNRQAFLRGYASVPGIDALLPAGDGQGVLGPFFELDKALYELAYERSFRPEWERIPAEAIERLLAG
ncbi:MAG TPA: phosphotransferase [Acidimicrobiales bacterium]|nr:phosphotransferase [Acidimicrobiales bacterium]